MTHNPIEFEVEGKPATQGSKRAFVITNKGGEVVRRQSTGAPVVALVEANKNLPQWRETVKEAARKVYHEPVLLGPVKLEVTFYRPHLKSSMRSGRYENTLKSSAKSYPYTRPDSSKLLRGLEDALSGVIWKDDSQVVITLCIKDWGEKFLTRVKITPLPPTLEERKCSEALAKLTTK